MLSLWSVRTVCVWITGRKDSCCLTVTSMCWEMRNRPVWKNCLWSGSMWRRFRYIERQLMDSGIELSRLASPRARDTRRVLAHLGE